MVPGDYFSQVHMLSPEAANALPKAVYEELSRIIAIVPNHWELRGDEHKEEYDKLSRDINASLENVLENADLSKFNPAPSTMCAAWTARFILSETIH